MTFGKKAKSFSKLSLREQTTTISGDKETSGKTFQIIGYILGIEEDIIPATQIVSSLGMMLKSACSIQITYLIPLRKIT
jgi:hypothetical protein